MVVAIWPHRLCLLAKDMIKTSIDCRPLVGNMVGSVETSGL